MSEVGPGPSSRIPEAPAVGPEGDSGALPDLAELRRLAEAATPGPWEYECEDSRRNGFIRCVHGHLANIWNAAGARGRFPGQGSNGQYIAAVHPRAILALLAENDRLRAALERIRDCDWTITLPDRMDGVRDIARAALAQAPTTPPAPPERTP